LQARSVPAHFVALSAELPGSAELPQPVSGHFFGLFANRDGLFKVPDGHELLYPAGKLSEVFVPGRRERGTEAGRGTKKTARQPGRLVLETNSIN